jgi:hypothetical protein
MASALPEKLFAQSSSSDVFSNRNLGAYTQGLMTQVRFQGLVGSVFTADLGNGRYAYLKLLSVQAVAPPAPSPSQPVISRMRVSSVASPVKVAKSTSSSFNLNFSTGGQLLPQSTYTLDHGTLGSFAVFLVPGDPVHGGTCSACFNLL